MLNRKEGTKPERRTEMAMIPMSSTAYGDNRNNNALDGAAGKINPASNTQASSENDYAFSKFDPPSAAAAADPSVTYDSLLDDAGNPEVPRAK